MIFIDYLLSYLTVDGLIILVVFLIGILTSIVVLIGRYFFKKISAKIEKMNEISKKYYRHIEKNEQKIKELEENNEELKEEIKELKKTQGYLAYMVKMSFDTLYGVSVHGVKNGKLEHAVKEFTKMKL